MFHQLGRERNLRKNELSVRVIFSALEAVKPGSEEARDEHQFMPLVC